MFKYFFLLTFVSFRSRFWPGELESKKRLARDGRTPRRLCGLWELFKCWFGFYFASGGKGRMFPPYLSAFLITRGSQEMPGLKCVLISGFTCTQQHWYWFVSLLVSCWWYSGYIFTRGHEFLLVFKVSEGLNSRWRQTAVMKRSKILERKEITRTDNKTNWQVTLFWSFESRKLTADQRSN